MTTRTRYSADQLLHSAVMNELDWAPGVHAERIGVAVTDGAVTLSGEVASLAEKDAAVRAAVRVRGATALADAIVVRDGAGPINDADIAREAGRVLSQHAELDDQAITATVEHGVLTLVGAVDRDSQRIVATEAVATLLGVRTVNNRMSVKPAAPTVDIRTRIEETLGRTAEIDSAQIKVEVHEGLVTLNGCVRCWSERQLVERVAWWTPGVAHVQNNLVISYCA